MNSSLLKVFELLILSWITAKRQLIHDRTASRTEWNNEYDFIVVGAGAAGCVVARRLAESEQATVLLLEAGGAQNAIYNDIPGVETFITDKRPSLQWMQYTEPQPLAARGYASGRVLQSSGKTLGGSSTHNMMIYNRGNARGYDEWVHKYGAKGWSFKDVLPYFKRFENNMDKNIVLMNPGYHSTSGQAQISTSKATNNKLLKLKQFFNSIGFMDTDINGPNQTGVIRGQLFITTKGMRSSASNAYIDPNPYPKSLHIVTKALVTKILFNGLTAVGVEFAKNDKPFRVYAQKEVIISAGAVNTPQILMLSGVGPKEHLNKFKIPVVLDLPVGSNYQNHLKILSESWSPGPLVQTEALKRIYFYKTGQLQPIQINFGGLYFSTSSNNNTEWPNGLIVTYLDQNGGLSVTPFLFRLQSRGTIRLQSTSPYVQPVIDENPFSDPRDYITAIESMSFLYSLKEHPRLASVIDYASLASVGCPPCPGLNDSQCIRGIKCFIDRETRADYHPCGTCRMGDVNRSDVVVDPYLRVKHAKNLRVCDASIMPAIPNGNLYAPSLMIGEKCAQIIKDFHRL